METTLARLSTIRSAQLAFAVAAVIAVLAPIQSAEARGDRSGVARDHRVNAPVVRDHRANGPVVRDHRSKRGPADVSGYSGGVRVTRSATAGAIIAGIAVLAKAALVLRKHKKAKAQKQSNKKCGAYCGRTPAPSI